jgi:polar amino acid transport system substrate-binding protein
MLNYLPLPLRGALVGLLLAVAAPATAAGCSRTLVVPMSPLGISVTVEGDKLGGIYPRLLKSITARTGCEFKTSVVPRARLESMFELGLADLLVPASQTPHRDQLGEFVSLATSRAMLVSVDHKRAPVHSLAELLERRELRVAVVRGNDYGEAYQAAVAELTRQGRLYQEPDPLRVARLLGGGMADVTILTPTTLGEAIKEDARVKPLLDQLRIEELPELPARHSGVYLSRKSLSAEDRRVLADQLRAYAESGAVEEEYRRHYPASLLGPGRGKK